MPSDLPLAPDRAALSNKISMLIASRSSLLKTLNPTSAPSKPSRHAADDDSEDLHIGQANHGVGYVPTKAEKEVSQNDRLLARRMLGKRGGKGETKRAVEDSESEGEGRSAIGRKKRKRAPAEPKEPEDQSVEEKMPLHDETQRKAGDQLSQKDDKGDGEPEPPLQERKKREKKNKSKKPNTGI